MMKNTALDVQKHAFSAADRLLFDANIWMYIFGPQGNPADWKTNIYSKALADLLRVGSEIFLDVLVLSEFINRCARLEHQILANSGQASQDFKSFRDSPDFEPVAKSIRSNVQRILKHCTRIESDFVPLDIRATMDEYESNSSDFNDLVLAALCRSHGLALVTHDADFINHGLTVISANNRLLRS